MSCLNLSVVYFFFFNDTATTEIYTLSLHDALPICVEGSSFISFSITEDRRSSNPVAPGARVPPTVPAKRTSAVRTSVRSEEHTSELQSRQYLVCRLLLEKKKKNTTSHYHAPIY